MIHTKHTSHAGADIRISTRKPIFPSAHHFPHSRCPQLCGPVPLTQRSLASPLPRTSFSSAQSGHTHSMNQPLLPALPQPPDHQTSPFIQLFQGPCLSHSCSITHSNCNGEAAIQGRAHSLGFPREVQIKFPKFTPVFRLFLLTGALGPPAILLLPRS